jgi:hypothetical protein
MQAEPRQLAIEPLAILRRGEVAIFEAPIGNRAGDAVHELPHAVFALARADFAVEIFAADDVRRQLAPERRYLAVRLFENQLAVFALDLSAANFPIDGGEQIFNVGRTELSIDLQAAVKFLGAGTGSLGRRHGMSSGHLGTSCAMLKGILPK